MIFLDLKYLIVNIIGLWLVWVFLLDLCLFFILLFLFILLLFLLELNALKLCRFVEFHKLSFSRLVLFCYYLFQEFQIYLFNLCLGYSYFNSHFKFEISYLAMRLLCWLSTCLKLLNLNLINFFINFLLIILLFVLQMI